ncbi:MAG TPA: methyltransferase domain-containing protein [Bacteriovoracaceae bacterium]|nr:methyltransferase domain-containing protein [Bacteriovoracaceae bacterium]
MDNNTVDAYNKLATTFAKKHQNVTPTRLYELTKVFFKKDLPTADLGCGIGRDTFWLSSNGFPTVGYDPSHGMLEIAKKAHPELTFKELALPDTEIISGAYDNIFCCAVLMHIPREQIVTCVISLLNALKPKGHMILSFRAGNGEEDGRLFETYHPGQIAQLFESLGGKVLLIEQDGIWSNLVIEKSDLSKREGIQQIQDIISRDKKIATYKFALIRALCEISRYESHVVTWYRDGDMVLVPIKRLAVRWVHYYFPLVKSSVRQTTSERMAFEEQMLDLELKPSEIALLKERLENYESDRAIKNLIKKVAHTIKVGPVKYAGGGSSPVFNFVTGLDASVYREMRESELGMVTVPITLWRDISAFSHWIEDSLSIQWAQLTEKMNRSGNFASYLDLITKSVQEDVRTTYEIRKLFKGKKIECVWTGKKLDEFAVDHMIPWTLWRNNDLWNLLPADPKVNGRKSDGIPSGELIVKRFDTIKWYWEEYAERFPELFERQIVRGLGVSAANAFTNEGKDALVHTISRVSLVQGGWIWGNG